VRSGPMVRYLVMEFTVDGQRYRAEILDEPKSERQLLRRLYAHAADRLRAMFCGEREEFLGEEEVRWGILAHSWELLEMEASG
jgi:hypothetical protein